MASIKGIKRIKNIKERIVRKSCRSLELHHTAYRSSTDLFSNEKREHFFAKI
jgi:hypothetical protein